MESQMTSKSNDLEKIIAQLMQYPDLSLGLEFNIKGMLLGGYSFLTFYLAPPEAPEFSNTLHHMIEHNNLRISLLENPLGSSPTYCAVVKTVFAGTKIFCKILINSLVREFIQFHKLLVLQRP